MRRIIAPLFLVFLLALMACEPSTRGTGPDHPPQDSVPGPPAVPTRYASPEGIAFDGQHVYISNVGKELNPQEKDGDGYLLKLSLDLKSSFDNDKLSAIKLNAPKGMAVLGKRLYVADIDRVVVIDLKTLEQVAEFDFSRFGVDFLNDIAVKDDSTLFVSATNSNQIFQVNVREDNFAPLKIDQLRGPNGLFYQSEENKLYCVEWGTGEPDGRVIAIDPPTGKIRVLGSHTGNLDGIAFLRNGDLAFSDWASNSILRMDMMSGEVSSFYSDSLGGPADFGYDTGSDKLYVPFMVDSRVLILPGSAAN